MPKNAKQRIDAILEEAHEEIGAVLDDEARKLLEAEPTRYRKFVLAVGWGPMLFDTNGRTAEPEAMSKRARAFMKLADHVFETCGGDNRQVTATA